MLREQKNHEVFNSVLAMDDTHNSIIEMVALYKEERRKLTDRFLPPEGVFTYRRVKMPNRKPRPMAMATAESGFCRIASSAWFAVSTALSWARLICLLAMRETVEVRL